LRRNFTEKNVQRRWERAFTTEELLTKLNLFSFQEGHPQKEN